MSATQRERAAKAFELFRRNPRHPSLNLEKLRGHADLWSFRVSQGDRVIARPVPDAEEETWELLDIGPHDIYRRR